MFSVAFKDVDPVVEVFVSTAEDTVAGLKTLALQGRRVVSSSRLPG